MCFYQFCDESITVRVSFRDYQLVSLGCDCLGDHLFIFLTKFKCQLRKVEALLRTNGDSRVVETLPY